MAVAVAAVYAPKLNHGLLHPYSLCIMVATIKAVAVCPEGKELFELPSGRGLRTVYFMPFTRPAMIAAENASDTSMRPHWVRLSYPDTFIPTIAMAGAYCR